jgi:hypothetical protein
MPLRFHPADRSSQAMFARSHKAIMDRIHAMLEIQRSADPITPAQYAALQVKRPERWGALPYVRPYTGTPAWA